MKIFCNDQDQNVTTGLTVSQLLEQLKLDSRQVAVEVNYELIPRVHHAEQVLQEGDHLEIVTLVGGG